MLRSAPLLAALLLSLPLAARAGAAAEPQAYRLVVGELPPFATEHGDKGPGSLVEVTQELSRRLGKPPTVEFFPWQRALAMSTSLPHVAVLPLTRTPERESQYRWLVRLYWQDFVFVGRHGKPDLNDIPGLMNRKIAVLRGSPHLKVLTEAKFRYVSECSTANECMRMVMTGIVDATYGGAAIHHSVASLGGYKESDFDYSPAFRTGEVWLAGSLDFSQAEIERWKAAMKSMRADGSYARILHKYGLDPDKAGK